MNIVQELNKAKKTKVKSDTSDGVINLVNEILQQASEDDLRIYSSLGIDGFIYQTEKKLTLSEGEYSESQIMDICNAYDFRILPTRKYKGSFPPELGSVIKNFIKKEFNSDDISRFKNSFYIMAPVESFSTTKYVPIEKDPVLFYKTTNYHQVYQWGNDFKITRVYRSMFTTIYDDDNFSNLLGFIATVIISSVFLIGYIFSSSTSSSIIWMSIFAFVTATYFIIMSTGTYYDNFYNKDSV